MSKRRVSIMQPTYLPWAGYFNLISKSDIFVFLDDVQFSKQSWQNRNKIIMNYRVRWLTVPVIRISLDRKINEIMFDDTQKWRNKHYKSIKHSYQNHSYFDQIQPILDIINNNQIVNLSDLNIRIIKHICEILTIETENIYLSSELGISGARSERLIKIIRKFDCGTYLSPIGSKDYIEKDIILNQSKIEIIYQNYIPKEYKQKNLNTFRSHLSIIDVIANIGIKKTKTYIIDKS